MEKKEERTTRPRQAPSTEEIRQLRNTQEEAQSQLMQMEFEELIREVGVKYKAGSKIEELLKKLKTLIEQIPASKVSRTNFRDSPGFPLSEVPESLSISYGAPSRVDLVGSYLVRTVLKSNRNVDLLVTMPETVFESTDFLNRVYFYKRALYLCHIASQLSDYPDVIKVSFLFFQNDVTKPILLVKPNQSKYSVKLHFSVAPDVFPEKKMHPQRVNVYRSFKSPEQQTPTPHYTHAIQEDFYFREVLQQLHEACQSMPSLVGAILLAKVWLRKRELDLAGDQINGCLFSLIYVYLRSIQVLSPQMSSSQIFRTTLRHLNDNDLSHKVLSLTNQPVSPEQKKRFTVFPLCLLSTDGLHNVFGRVTASAYRELRRHVSMSLLSMEMNAFLCYQSLFLQSVTFSLSNDLYYRVTIPSVHDDSPAFQELLCDLTVPSAYLKTVEELIQRALGDRIIDIRCYYSCPRWSISEPVPALPVLRIGLLIHPLNVLRQMDRGPQANLEAESRSFKDFWGDKAEIRRFKDGSILQCVSWAGSSAKRSVATSIIQYTLGRHIPHLEKGAVKSIGEQTDRWISRDLMARYSTTYRSFESLSQTLRNLTFPTFAIDTVQLTGECMRPTSLYSPEPLPLLLLRSPASRVIRSIPCIFTISNMGEEFQRDPNAFRAKRLGILLQLHEALHAQQISSYLTEECLDVAFDNYLFRLSFFHPMGTALLKQEHGDFSPEHQRLVLETHHAPTHTIQTRSFVSQFPSYGDSVRFVKLWLHSHCFSGHFTDEAVETMVASLFYSPQPFPVPSSTFTVFLRFLHLLTTFPWKDTPLVVDPQGNLGPAQLAEIQQVFEETRAKSPANALLFVVTPLDEVTHWRPLFTWNHPAPHAWERLQLYASRTLHLVVKELRGESSEIVSHLLHTPTEGFDVELEIDEKYLPPLPAALQGLPSSFLVASDRGLIYETAVYKNLLDSILSRSLVDFNPLERLVDEISAQFGEQGLVFYDGARGNRVFLVWDPHAFLPFPFKKEQATHSMPLVAAGGAGKPQILLSIFEVLNAIKGMGAGLITAVHLGDGRFEYSGI